MLGKVFWKSYLSGSGRYKTNLVFLDIYICRRDHLWIRCGMEKQFNELFYLYDSSIKEITIKRGWNI